MEVEISAWPCADSAIKGYSCLARAAGTTPPPAPFWKGGSEAQGTIPCGVLPSGGVCGGNRRVKNRVWTLEATRYGG